HRYREHQPRRYLERARLRRNAALWFSAERACGTLSGEGVEECYHHGDAELEAVPTSADKVKRIKGRGDCGRITGKPAVIDSTVGLVPSKSPASEPRPICPELAGGCA